MKLAFLTSLRAFTVLALAAMPLMAAAQDYPTKPIRMLLGFSPGGSSDVVARILAQQLTQILGQPVIVENRAGASGTIASAALLQSPADGYTIQFIGPSYTGVHALYPNLPFDAKRDFIAVAGVVQSPMVLIVSKKSPYSNAQTLFADMKRNPGKLNFGSGGGGATITSLIGEIVKEQTNLKFETVLYKGTAPAMTAIIQNEVDFTFDAMSGSKGMIDSGEVRPLAVTSLHPSKTLPNVPALAELLNASIDARVWFGVVAPAKTPTAVITRLNQAINDVLNTPEMIARLHAMGIEPMPGTPQQFEAMLDQETAMMTGLIKRLDLKP
jgi:tripartite-type tricarboxylate transporter receptor subunit TctC